MARWLVADLLSQGTQEAMAVRRQIGSSGFRKRTGLLGCDQLGQQVVLQVVAKCGQKLPAPRNPEELFLI